jgi:hypothetical protein
VTHSRPDRSAAFANTSKPLQPQVFLLYGILQELGTALSPTASLKNRSPLRSLLLEDKAFDRQMRSVGDNNIELNTPLTVNEPQ